VTSRTFRDLLTKLLPYASMQFEDVVFLREPFR
jgi:hypothetical protein